MCARAGRRLLPAAEITRSMVMMIPLPSTRRAQARYVEEIVAVARIVIVRPEWREYR